MKDMYRIGQIESCFVVLRDLAMRQGPKYAMVGNTVYADQEAMIAEATRLAEQGHLVRPLQGEVPASEIKGSDSPVGRIISLSMTQTLEAALATTYAERQKVSAGKP